MANLGNMWVSLGARMEGLRKAEPFLRKFEAKANSTFGNIRRKVFSLQTAIVTLAGGFGLKMLASSMIGVAASFELMEVKLDTLTRGRGVETLKEINAWALRMPVDTRKAVDAYTKMQAMGLDPTIKKMQTLVDVASIMGEDTLPRVARALGQMATLGKLSAEELNQLSESGINARKYLTAAFGTTVEGIQKSGVAIEKVIDVIWKGMTVEFGGAAEKMMDSWNGLKLTTVSYLVEIQRRIMDAGIFTEMKKQLGGINNALSKWIDNNEAMIKQKVPEYMDKMKTTIAGLWGVIQNNKSLLKWGVIGVLLYGTTGPIGLAAFITAGIFTQYLKDFFKDVNFYTTEQGKIQKQINALEKKRDAAVKAREIRGFVAVGGFGGPDPNKGIKDFFNDQIKELEYQHAQVYNRRIRLIELIKQNQLTRGMISGAIDFFGVDKYIPPKPDDEGKDTGSNLIKVKAKEWASMTESTLALMVASSQAAADGMTPLALTYDEMIEQQKELAEITKKTNERIGRSLANVSFGPAAKKQTAFLKAMTISWGNWTDFAVSSTTLVVSTISKGFSETIKATLRGDFKEIGRSWNDLMGNMLDSFIDLLTEMLVKWAANKAIQWMLGGTEAGAGAAAGTSGGSDYGIVGNFLYKTVKGIFGFHHGTSSVPFTGVAEVHQGERILSVQQNESLIKSLQIQAGDSGTMVNLLASIDEGIEALNGGSTQAGVIGGGGGLSLGGGGALSTGASLLAGAAAFVATSILAGPLMGTIVAKAAYGKVSSMLTASSIAADVAGLGLGTPGGVFGGADVGVGEAGMGATYASGSAYIPYDQYAKVHAGERILNRTENREVIDAMKSAGGGETHYHFHNEGVVTEAEWFSKEMADHVDDRRGRELQTFDQLTAGVKT